MAKGKANRSPAWGQFIHLLGFAGIYPTFQAFSAGLPVYGSLVLAVSLTLIIIGWRLYRRGQDQEPESTIRTYDHREPRPPGTSSDRGDTDD